MSKITFRADDDLVEELEALETSKSEAMREALRAYLEEEEEVSGTSVQDGSDGAENESAARANETAIDDLVRERVDELLTERLAEMGYNAHGREGQPRPQSSQPQDVNVTIALEDGRARRVDEAQGSASSHARPHTQARSDSRAGRESEHGRDRSQHPQDEPQSQSQSRTPSRQRTCGQCGEDVDGEHVFCPNCGEKVSRRLFCDCGDELRSDWAFCPSCGRRTASADVLESNSQRS
ncbi:double zinc ribbon domain-containing protein [Halopiger xanaduensis]|uniref:Putative transcriptional regulator, CopG family n=1 Tax=Halopiger xanaduensis (strain DSM 18323 / JCM 14033 / SH-6) TaxID=797210 RepID=F8D8B4_HALXS|nr:zinc ribbon domain-containing protein [Halopiger xanaduensis]AEH36866.1 putative transcriptional regulator, CopG family [Halopiger xanaduensis SH-6]